MHETQSGKHVTAESGTPELGISWLSALANSHFDLCNRARLFLHRQISRSKNDDDMTSLNTDRLLQPYAYRPLRSGLNNIRLLQILPGTGSTEIFCQVFQYTLRIEKAFGLYEALSYVWGDASDPQQIWVKNAEDEHYCTFMVTRNLYGALHRLRDADLPRTVWIDAVCINQDNLEERASQVQIMARIYAYAVSVTVWLGEEADDSSNVLSLLRRIVAQDLKYSYNWRAVAESMLSPAADAIVALLGRSWFRRAWVVQEAAVARVVSVTCGDAETTGAIFASGMELAFSLLRDKFKQHEAIPPVLMFMDQSNGAFPLLQKLADLHTTSIIPSFNVLPLGDLLRLFQNHEATDKRDKIYALLGLSSDNDVSPDLRPDYTKGWMTLFRQIIAHVLGPGAVACTWDDKEHAVISEIGSVMGTISKGLGGNLTVVSPIFGSNSEVVYSWRASWRVSHDAGSVQHGDILVFFQNARRPSLIRPCGDHFDIVMISLPAPPVVVVEQSPRSESWEDLHVRWEEFAPGARRSSRKFDLVWDWTADHDQDSKAHKALLNSCENPRSSETERRFNTARVLDDLLSFARLAALLRERPDPSNFGPMEKHFILLDHVLANWPEYLHMKGYFATLHWCMWSLHAPINLDYLLDYWHHAGPLTPDLFEIVELVEANVGHVARLKPGYRYTCMQIEPWQHVLYPLIFPTYSLPMAYDQEATGVVGTISPHNSLYLMRLVLASQTSFQNPPETVLERIYHDPILGDKFHYIILMLMEHRFTHLDVDFYVDLATQRLDADVHHALLGVLFVELAHNPGATYFFLNSLLQLQLTHREQARLWNDVLRNNMETLTFHFRNTVLCKLEMAAWGSARGLTHSVLRVFDDCLKGNSTEWDWPEALSLHNTARLYTVETLARWTQKVLLYEIARHNQRKDAAPRRRQRRYSIAGSDVSQISSEAALSSVA
ncbi:heterokaryon incompatibility protein-domain-containing protein [Boeremia exigua]|uniref:heterokaryon incompatibility protein-domain-containing protein n=1 Tax=Boeremia exigua TaxID=749465 RepID=UPI001E8D4467|nr:heterokaryon incompatibility protein-domain-containing protein [Boeremia exigua]KAH6639674.1 heterokaryon incompatibility protein-domain-containing protein [Boeremia exigua]